MTSPPFFFNFLPVNQLITLKSFFQTSFHFFTVSILFLLRKFILFVTVFLTTYTAETFYALFSPPLLLLVTIILLCSIMYALNKMSIPDVHCSRQLMLWEDVLQRERFSLPFVQEWSVFYSVAVNAEPLKLEKLGVLSPDGF